MSVSKAGTTKAGGGRVHWVGRENVWQSLMLEVYSSGLNSSFMQVHQSVAASRECSKWPTARTFIVVVVRQDGTRTRTHMYANLRKIKNEGFAFILQ